MLSEVAVDATAGSIEVTGDGTTLVLHLTGEFDLANQHVLAARLGSLRQQGQPVVVDLSAATFIDTTVINALVAAHRDGLEIAIRGAAGTQRRALEVLGIPDVFPFVD